jgi:hypothetical protein
MFYISLKFIVSMDFLNVKNTECSCASHEGIKGNRGAALRILKLVNRGKWPASLPG